jgi:hypothetical protein
VCAFAPGTGGSPVAVIQPITLRSDMSGSVARPETSELVYLRAGKLRHSLGNRLLASIALNKTRLLSFDSDCLTHR